MATKIWSGSGDGTTFSSAANWSGGAPANDDTLIINTTSAAIAGAATGLTGITLKVGAGFSGTIGSSSTYLDLDGPDCFFASSGTAAYLTGTWTNFRITGGSPASTFLNLKGSGDTVITNLYSTQLVGTATVNSSATTTNVFATGARSGTLDIKSGVTITALQIGNAFLKNTSNATTCEVFSGELTLSGSSAITTLEIDGDGLVRHLSSGTIGTLTVFDGRINASENESTTFTVTTSSVHVSGLMDFSSALNNAVFTNPVSMLGGEFRPPTGSQIRLS